MSRIIKLIRNLFLKRGNSSPFRGEDEGEGINRQIDERRRTFIFKEEPPKGRGIFFPVMMVVFLLAGCVKTPTKVEMPPKPDVPARPPLEKTFGEMTFIGIATLLIQYKDIAILIDPVFAEGGAWLGPYEAKLGEGAQKGDFGTYSIQRTGPSALRLENLAPVDYLLLTDVQPHHFDAQAQAGLRKDLKILAPQEALPNLIKAGFTQARVLTPGQKIMLQKNNGHVFVSAVHSRNPVTRMDVNSYLLEFDNGRNVFVSGDAVDLAVIRNLVYQLRDDGKEVTLALIYGGGIRTEDGRLLSPNEDLAAQIISLLQPREALVVQTESLNVATMNRGVLEEALRTQIYMGPFRILTIGEKAVF